MAHTSSRFATRCLIGISALAFTAGLIAQTVENPVPVDTSGCTTVKMFLPRSQGRDKVRQLAGSVGYTHLMRSADDGWYSMFTVTPEYTQSFRGSRLARNLFGSDVCPCGKKYGLKIQGRGIAKDPDFTYTDPDAAGGPAVIPNPFLPEKRDAKAWLADYFYLPQDFESTVCFNPQIKNFLVDLDLFVGFDRFCEGKCRGLYFRLHGPITHTRWDLGMCEEVSRKGVLNHPAGYFTPDVLERSFLLNSFSSYAAGNAPGDGRIKQTWNINAATDGPITTTTATQFRHFDTNFEPLRYARMATHDLKLTGFAELRAEFGWDFVECEDYHAGINFQVAAPTGTRPNPCYLFNPIVGNGHFWEVGGGMTGHWLLWRNEDESREVSFHYDINVTHMFKDRQKRTFELKNRPNSAYMIAQRGVDPSLTSVIIDGTYPPGPFNASPTDFRARPLQRDDVYTFAPLANISTLDVKVGIDVQADIVAMLNMKLCGFSFDLGYNFWMRGCERISLLKEENQTDLHRQSLNLAGDRGGFGDGFRDRWSLKGDAQVFAYGGAVAYGTTTYKDLGTPPSPYRIPVSESRATIHDAPRGAGTIDPTGGPPPTGLTGGSRIVANSGVDNPAYLTGLKSLPGSTTSQPINASYTPVTLSLNDLDFVRTRGLSHKVFGHLTYELDTCGFEVGSCRASVPFIGLGFFGEFGDNNSCNDRCTKICENSCMKTSLSQWGVWLKGGVSFR